MSTNQVLDLFCGCGGFSLGAKSIGLTTVGVDSSKSAGILYSHNVGKAIVTDITQENSIPDHFLKSPIWIAGIPCQAFSSIGKRDPNDPRRNLVGFTANLIARHQPNLLLIEEVLPALTTLKRDLVEPLDSSYSFQILKLDSSLFGVPQARKRVFIIGAKKGINLPDLGYLEKGNGLRFTLLHALSEKSHYLDYLNGSSLPKYSKWWGIRRAEPKTLEGIERLSYGNRCQVGRFRKSNPFKPAYTQLARYSIHPIHNRFCSVLEAARIQSFPDSYDFSIVAPTNAIKAIGNSVCPLVSKHIFKNLDELGVINDAINHI